MASGQVRGGSSWRQSRVCQWSRLVGVGEVSGGAVLCHLSSTRWSGSANATSLFFAGYFIVCSSPEESLGALMEAFSASHGSLSCYGYCLPQFQALSKYSTILSRSLRRHSRGSGNKAFGNVTPLSLLRLKPPAVVKAAKHHLTSSLCGRDPSRRENEHVKRLAWKFISGTYIALRETKSGAQLREPLVPSYSTTTL
jgi:hypothetical protein